jgi:transposase
LNSDIKNTAERNGISEQEIETMLKDLGEDLITAKPNDLKKLGIDEIAMIKGQGNYGSSVGSMLGTRASH